MPIFTPHARIVASADGKRYEILAIAVGPWHESKKGPTGKPIYSTEESLRASVSVFEGLPVAAYELKPGFRDHLPESILSATEENGIVFLKNKVGRLSGSRFETTANGEKGIVVSWDINDSQIEETVRSSIDSSNPDFDGFSIDGVASWTVQSIGGVEYDVPVITSGKTLDMVKHPAAGGKVLRLAASFSLEEKQMNLTATQRATIIVILEASGVGDEILNALISQAPEAFINKGRELLAKEREFLKKFDDTLAKFEKGEEPEIPKGAEEKLKDMKALADKATAESAAAKAKEESEAAAKTEADKKAEAETTEAGKVLEEARALANEAKTTLGEMAVEREVTASALPPIAKVELVQRLKASRIFEVPKIKTEIDKEAAYIKRLVGNDYVPLNRVTGSIVMAENETDNLILALRGMLKGQDILDSNKRKVPRFQSLREMNSRITGSRSDEPLDRVFRKLSRLGTGIGFEASDLIDPKTGRLTASFTTSDLASVFLVAMHNQFIADYQTPTQYDMWRNIAKIVSMKDLYAHKFTRSGWYAAAPSIAEGGTYQEITTAPSDENISMTAQKYGHIMSITDVMVINDMIGEFVRLQAALSDGMKRDIYLEVMNVIRTNTAVAYGSDTDTLVCAAHSNGVASAGTDLTDSAVLQAGIDKMRAQTEFGSSMKLGDLNKPRYLLVHNSRLGKAKQLTMGDRYLQAASSDASEFWSAYGSGQLLPDSGALNAAFGTGIIPIEMLNATVAANWWLLSDPNTTPAPAVMVGFLNGQEQPEVVTEPANTGSNFTADKIRIKIKNWRDTEPGDHRGIYGQFA